MSPFEPTIATGAVPQIYAILILGGYLLGAIPFGLVLTRLAGLGDIREIGSGNIGATNVLRTGNKGLAAATLVLDASKAGIAAFIGSYWGLEAGIVAGVAALIGHLFPVWLNFKGGKGVATFLGLNIALYWPVGLALCMTWLIAALLFRISSLSALFAASLAPFYYWAMGEVLLAQASAFLALLIWVMHRDNVKRLFEGAEPRIGQKKN